MPTRAAPENMPAQAELVDVLEALVAGQRVLAACVEDLTLALADLAGDVAAEEPPRERAAV